MSRQLQQRPKSKTPAESLRPVESEAENLPHLSLESVERDLLMLENDEQETSLHESQINARNAGPSDFDDRDIGGE